MYFWNTKQLAEDIKSNKLSDNDWKNYYLAGLILGTLTLYLSVLSPRESTTALLVEVILMIGIAIFGVSVTFNTHKTSDKNVASYISKMVALIFPLTIKFIVLAMVLGFIEGIVYLGPNSSPALLEWSMTAVQVTISTLVFWRLNVHLQSINT